MDMNARRTGGLNIAEEIARKLEMNYAFGREIQELTHGSRTACLSRPEGIIEMATGKRWVVRLRRQSTFWRPRWFVPRTNPFQKRLGERIALVTDVLLRGRGLTFYNLDLESRGGNDLRLSHLEETIGDAGPRVACAVGRRSQFRCITGVAGGRARA
jgi:hypothetical protein